MKKKNIKVLVLAFLVVALGAAVLVVQRTQETRRGAAGSGLPVIFSPADGTYQVGDTITTHIDIGQPAGKSVSTFILKVTYDSQLLRLKTTAGTAKATDNIVVNTFSPSGNEISIIGGTNSFTSGNLRAIRLEFEAKQEGSVGVGLNESQSQVLTCTVSGSGCQPGTESVFTDFATQSANYQVGDGGDRPEIAVSLSPNQGEKKIGKSFDVAFSANTGNNKISGLEAIFTFDESKLEVLEVNFPTGSANAFDAVLTKTISNGKVRVVATASRPDAQLKSGSFLLGTFTLKGKVEGLAVLSLDLADFSGISATDLPLEDELIRPANLKGSYTFSDSPPPSPTPTDVLPTACSVDGVVGRCLLSTASCPADHTGYDGDSACDAAGGQCCIANSDIPDSLHLTFKIKFDEVSRKIPDQVVSLIVKKRGKSKEVSNVTVVSDANGVLTGEVDLLGIDPGPGYYFIIKGPKHIAERLCVQRQDRYCPAGTTLTLGMDNVFDFSGWPLRAGDIAGENGTQDGKIDSLDWNYLVTALVLDDDTKRHKANLNFNLQPDGSEIVAGDDVRLFVKTMGTKYDDDY